MFLPTAHDTHVTRRVVKRENHTRQSTSHNVTLHFNESVAILN